jgi:carbamoyl-phosphate synthase large subunit
MGAERLPSALVAAVLFTCAGQRVDIVTAFGRAGATTVAADADPLAPALYHADRRAIVPPVADAGYLDSIGNLVSAHGIDLIVPLNDLDHVLLAGARDRLDAAVLLPDVEVVERMNDKYLAHLLFEERGVASPATWLPDDLPGDLPFPVLVKARRGFGSRNIYRAADRDQLDFYLQHTPVESIVQAACAGAEFSIDVFCDFEGRCLNAIPRTMIESKGGESIKGQTIKDWDLIEYGRFVAEAVGLKGPANIQCFREADGTHRVTDVNARFGGGFPLPLAAGSRYPELALALANGERPEPRVGEFRAGVTMTRFFSHLCLTAGDDGTLEPFAEEVPEPIASEPGEA